MINEFYKIIGVVFISAVLVLTLRGNKSEYAFLLSATASFSIAALIVVKVFPTLKFLGEVYKNSSGNGYDFSVILKALAISYIAQICSNTCRDFGQSALAEKTELAGRCAILVLSVPLLKALLQRAIDFASL